MVNTVRALKFIDTIKPAKASYERSEINTPLNFSNLV